MQHLMFHHTSEVFEGTRVKLCIIKKIRQGAAVFFLVSFLG